MAQDKDGRQALSGFRWGWDESADKKDWKPHFQNTTVHWFPTACRLAGGAVGAGLGMANRVA